MPEIKPFNSKTRTREYIRDLYKWTNDLSDQIDFLPDGKDYPEIRKGDAILLLKPTLFEEPNLEGVVQGTLVRPYVDKSVAKTLNGTVAEVIGKSGLEWQTILWDQKMQILCSSPPCLDNRRKYIDEQGSISGEFLFLPHPEMLDKFLRFLPFFCNYDVCYDNRLSLGELRESLREHYVKLEVLFN